MKEERQLKKSNTKVYKVKVDKFKKIYRNEKLKNTKGKSRFYRTKKVVYVIDTKIFEILKTSRYLRRVKLDEINMKEMMDEVANDNYE